MKYHNIIALCLGIFVAALLWQYYLWPKYQVKTEKSETIELLNDAAQKELEESIDYSEPGEILFVGDKIPGADMDTVANNLQGENIVFYSQANKPKDILDIISNDDIKKHTGVILEKDDFVVSPDAANQEQEKEQSFEQEVTQEDIQNDTSRITMIKIPEEFVTVQEEKAYKQFLQEHEGAYPNIDFSKQTFIAVVSSGMIADSFFEIVKVEENDREIQVFYRVNLIGSDKDKKLNNYKVMEKTDLNIKFIQVK